MPMKREMIGKPLTPKTIEVTRNKIRELAAATGDDNPVYHEVEAAREAGYKDLAMPLTFPTTFNFQGRLPRGASQEDLGIPKVGTLHGEEEYTYLAPIYPGDVLNGQQKIASIVDKKGSMGSILSASSRLRAVNSMTSASSSICRVCRSRWRAIAPSCRSLSRTSSSTR